MASQKPKPSMPKWWWLDSDGCWFCKNRNACHNCKYIKHDEKEKVRHQKYKITKRTMEEEK